jgi:putative FmdB family regulatory protein
VETCTAQRALPIIDIAMPLYEYYCPPCGTQFEVLRPMSKSEEPATCPAGHKTTNRVVSMFATMTRTADGRVEPAADRGGAAGCACACGGH